jgi:hypothetical protein
MTLLQWVIGCRRCEQTHLHLLLGEYEGEIKTIEVPFKDGAQTALFKGPVRTAM